jgi:3-deoxy-7-phosphoheptulonate synthase
VLEELPITPSVRETVTRARGLIRDAIAGAERRMVLISGPCSIHDPASALEYAEKFRALGDRIADRFIVIMRTYFEKPRTTVGWKGLIYDPAREESHDMNRGLRQARKVLLAIGEMGLPCATEFLDPIVPQYTADLVSWAAIGARTTESQTHRQMASGLSMPVGFKNATDGGVQTALDAMQAAARAHSFLGIDPEGRTCIVRTQGNSDVHIILRGGTGGPNYSPTHVTAVLDQLRWSGAGRPVMIDCGHGNSNKNYRLQETVFRDVMRVAPESRQGVLGLMLESHLVAGRQGISDSLVYGQSITDACLGWDDTVSLLLE